MSGLIQMLPCSQAGEKFKMALAIEPRKHDALWCLGNAYTSQVPLAPRCHATPFPCWQSLAFSQHNDTTRNVPCMAGVPDHGDG